MRTVIQSGPEVVRRAADLLAAGELVALPTETVYGLGADATNAGAVEKIYAAKGRPSHNPLIVHIADISAAERICQSFPSKAYALVQRFWPGPLTLVLPRRLHGEGVICERAVAGGNTVAVRCPAHPMALDILRAVNRPIAAPSANRSGFTSPTSPSHVAAEFDGIVELIVDGGECLVGLESTVLDLSGLKPSILRPGAITAEMLAPILEVEPAQLTANETTFASHAMGEALKSPGLLWRHYAPKTKAFRYEASQVPAIRNWLLEKTNLAIAQVTMSHATVLPHVRERFIMPAEPMLYAREFYRTLRLADRCGCDCLFIEMPAAQTGLWAAILDRLGRAAEAWSPEAKL